ncbi:MAG: carbohydrate kinase family protein [Candidatus Binatia bacterium]
MRSRVDKPFDVVGFGLNSVDHLCVVRRHPRLDCKERLVAYDVQPGGQVPTALVALQRWGLRTAYIGSFGDDPNGQLSRTSLEREGIDLSATVVRRGIRQPVSVILIDAVSGERSVLWEHTEALVLCGDEVRWDVVVAGRALLMDAVDVRTAVAAARRAKAAGSMTVLDVDTPAAGIADLLRCTNVLITGTDFPGRLTRHGTLRGALRAALRSGPWLAAATLGPGGALACARGTFHYVPAFRVPVVDSTGAGDVFHAGAIYGLLHGWAVPDTLRFAAAAAALKCEKLGARPGIPPLRRAMALAGL